MLPCQMCAKWRNEPDLRITELRRSFVMLNRDQFFPGYTFIIAKNHATELFHLDCAAREELMAEVSATASALYNLYKPDKMNYELLGNMVPHIHWHLVPRFRTDPLWPRPIWSEPHTDVMLTRTEYAERVEQIRNALIATGHRGSELAEGLG